MEARSVSEDDSSENSQSSGQKPLKPKRRSMVERELETNMTARVTSPLSFIEPGLNTSRYGRARKVKADKEFCDTNKSVSDYLKSPDSELSPKVIKSQANTSSTNNASLKQGTTPITKAENLIEKIHNENLSLSRFGSITKSTPLKHNKTYIRKDLIQRKDTDNPCKMLKTMFSPSKSPYKSSKSSHLSVFLERYSADKSGIEMNETVSTEGLTPGGKDCPSKKSRKRTRKSDTAITETKTNADLDSSRTSSSTKKSKRHSLNAINSVVVKTLDFNTKNKKALLRRQEKEVPKRTKPEKELQKSDQPKIEHNSQKQARNSSKKKNPKPTPITQTAEMPDEIEQPENNHPKSEQINMEQPSKKQTGSSSKRKNKKTTSLSLIEMPEPQGLLIEKTSVVKTLDFDIKKKPNKLKLTKTEANKEVEPDATKPESQAPLEIAISQDYFATNGLFEIESQCSYNVGDLAWSRVGTYPFWPCIVTREPFTELFVKKKLFGRVERDVIHVTFFADNGRRGWIVDNMLRQYHGIEEFLAARDGFTIEDKKKDPKLYAAYFISDKKRDTWNQAVNEAENLFKEPKHTRTDILYEMLSHNKNVKILKKPKTVKIETPNIDLKKPRPVKLDTTDSDVSLSESLYDSLFSDDDSKTVDPVKSKNRSRNKSFDVSDVVTACLDNMAVKTGMAKIQMQSHMDRWLQKAKSQTPEKKQIVLTPNKDRKLSLTLRKNKKTPVKTDTVKPYPLCKFAKESPDNGILNSLPTENDYTKYDVKNENPVYCDNVNTENTLVSADEVHYIESGTGIGTILAVESLSDKVSDNQETINDTDMDISSVIEDVSKDDKELFSNNTLDIATIETSYVNGAAMEIEHINSKNEECGLNITNLPPTDTEIPSNKDASVVSSNEIEQYPMKSTANGDDEPMDVEHDKPKNLVYDLETNMCNMQDNIHLSSEVNIKECKDITINNSENTVLSNVVDHDITDEKKLVVDQPDNILETTETNCDVIPKCVSHDFENNDAENCLGETVPEMQTHEPNVKQDINSGNDTDALANCKEKNTNANEEINFSNNHIQNREVINNQPKNYDLSNEAIVENITGSKCEETIDNRKSNTGTRKSLRRKSESPITAETDHQVNENSNINTIHEKTNKIVSELVDNTENKVKSIINNEVKQEKKDTKRKSGRLSSFDKLNQIPRVSVTKLNVYHMEICENKLNYPTKKVNDDIKIKNIEISGKDAAETKQKSNNPSKYVTDNDIQINNIDKSSILSTEPPKENHVCGIENIKTSETELIEKTLESKQILENGIYENNDQSTISNQYAKLNGTSELHINVISNLNDCKTIPEEKVTEDLLKKLKNNVRKSKRIEIKRSTNKSNDLQKEVEDAKIFLLQNIESPQNHPISPGLDDIKADASTNSNMTDERETRARDFDKEINLITSVIELTPDAKDVYRNVSNVIQADEGVTNNANENKQCSKKIFNNVCDQSIELDTSFEEIKSNRIESKSSLFGYSNRDNLSEPSNIDINLENAKCEYPHNIVGVSLNGKENIGLTSLTINELQHDNNISNLVNENTDDNSIKMSDYDNLVITPEKIINADVIIDNGNNDELDSSEDVKLNGISVISSIDTQLPRKRGRPRKSNPLVIDNVVIEEISLTDNQIDTIHSNNDVKVTVIDDLKPRKRGRPKKYQLAEQDKVLTNGYHQDPESLPEFAHLMDLDVSLDGADFNQTVKVENIALLTEVDLLAKVTEANLSSEPMDVDYCQVIPLSIKKEVYNEQQGITKGINENAYDLAQNVVDFNTNLEIIESPPTDTLITDKDNNTILINDETNNKQTEMDEKIEDIRTQNQNIESISLSSISIKSELESISSSNVQSETEEKQVTNKQTLNVEMMEATEKAKNKAGKIKQDSDEPSEEREIQDGISKRKQRVKPENKLTNEVYKALDDPEFAKYLEMRQDALIDENPHVSQDDIVKYLYKTWIYEQSLKPDAVKSDDLIESNLVKGLGNMSTSQPKKIKKRVKSQIDKEEKYDLNEVIIPRDRSKRRTNPLYINADDTDIEDELEMFEIFKNKNKAKRVTPTTLNSQTIDEKVIPTDGKTESEQDDIPLANLIADKDTQIIPEDLTEVQAEEVIEKPFDQVEYYFAQLTQPKPNVFKGLIRERVCDICFKTSNLVKCKGPCNGMFHIECVKEETTQVSVQNIWSRGRKKKKPRGPRPKNRSQDDSQSDDKDIIIEDIFESSVSVPIDADTFETQLADKMKEILEKDQVEDLASSDEELKWDDADPGKCEIVNITLKARRNPSHNSDIDFKCNDCLKLLIPKCYVCKSEKSPKNSVEIRQRCQIAQCHKYYHLDCLDMWPQTQFNQGESARKTSDLFDILSCPRHVCHSCVCDNPRGCNTRFSGEKLARCVKCPATYHSFTKCLPAGSQILSASHIICPRHTVNRPGKVPCHVNTGWCFICALGGSLICCEYCPTSFHADCLNIAPPEGNYMCEDCETGRLPLYGEMVWVKLGHYRWWPGLVLHPCEIPDNIICMRHSPGEFVVRFFGQYDHYWVNRGRVFPFQEGDSGRISSQRSKIDEAFTLAIEHAQRAFQILKTVPPNSEEEAEIAQSFLPPQYVRLRVNKPCGAVTIPCARAADEQNGLSQCDCDPRLERPCDANSQCLNRMLLTECGPSCRAEDRCQNRAFEKRLYPKMAPYRTPHRGWGLRTLEDVKAGQFVIEYVGELIDEVEFKRRMQLKHEIRDENYYFLTLDKERMIDAGPKGNLARFMNHSCEPNCETQKWTVLGDVRVGLFAIHDIPAFTELTFNYNLECAGIDKKRCMCGAPRCSGYIGAKPKTLEEINPKKKDVYKKRIYRKRKKEDSPSTTKIKIPKPRTTTRSKPKELTEIEKDLLIIKNATNGLLSSDSECSLKLILDEKTNKRKRSFSSEDLLNSDGVEPSRKILKLDMSLDSESPSSEGIS